MEVLGHLSMASKNPLFIPTSQLVSLAKALNNSSSLEDEFLHTGMTILRTIGLYRTERGKAHYGRPIDEHACKF